MKKLKSFNLVCQKLMDDQNDYGRRLQRLKPENQEFSWDLFFMHREDFLDQEEFLDREEFLKEIKETRIPEWQAEKLLAIDNPFEKIWGEYHNIDREDCAKRCSIGCRGGYACAIMRAARYYAE